MSNLIPLEEAAKILGVSPEDLTEARSRGEIHAYRDGKNWKFKLQEIERYKGVLSDVTESDNASDSVVRAGSSAIIDAELDELIDLGETSGLSLGDDVIDDSRVGTASSSSSTIIGKPKLADEITLDDVELDVPPPSDALSELKLTAGTDLPPSQSAPAAPRPEPEHEVVLEEDVDIGDSSELNLVESSIKLSGGSEVFSDAVSDDAGATGDLGKGAAVDEEDVMLDDEIPSLHLSDEDLELSLGSSSEISLDAGDLELAASDTGVGVTDSGSDVTLDASGSGINLSTPGDSGISLDHTPPELAVGGDEVLELGEAELVDFDEGLVEDEAMQADDDFLLSPSESDMGEGDSGSQVIALDSEEVDDEAATLIRGEEAESYTDDAQIGMAPIGIGAGVGEAPYSIVNVLSLGMVMVPLGISGLFVFDLVRNMWSWGGTYSLNSTIMDFILQMFG